MFGQNNTFSFSTAAPTTAPTTGGFGAPAAGKTTFSFGAPTNAPTAGTTAGFGSTMNRPTGFSFGATAPTTTSGGGGGIFGQTTQQPQSTTQTGGGGGLFGSTGGFGATTTTATTTQPGFGGFGASGGFGTQAATSAATGGFGGFGTTTTAPATSVGGFGGFGTGTTTTAAPTSTFNFNQGGQQQQQQQQQQFNLGMAQQQQQQQQQPATDHLMNALVSAQTFNDDRDLILAKWNQLQAFYGFGKIFYQNQAINISDDNRLTRFKTIGYSCKPSSKNEDGLVCLVIKGKQADIKANQAKYSEAMNKIFGSNPTIQIEIDSVKPLITEKVENVDKVEANTLVTFYVIERAPTGQTRRIPSLDVFNFLNKQETPTQALGSLTTRNTIKDQLNQLNVTSVYPLVQLNEEQIKEYLEKPPQGINPILWEQAKRHNPNPNKLIPVPIVGFQELNKRFKLQDQENQAQKSCLYKIGDDIDAINTKNKLLMNKIEQYKSKNEELEHRLLKVMINYEIRRKLGIYFQEDEKYFRNVLESLYIELSSPINKEIQKQKLNEFMEIVKTYELTNVRQGKTTSGSDENKANKIDLTNLEDVQKSLRDQHKIFKSLIEIINKDLNDINVIKRNLQA